MTSLINDLKRRNIHLFIDLIVELGFLRLRDECAVCKGEITVKDYHIQICKKCRIKFLENKN